MLKTPITKIQVLILTIINISVAEVIETDPYVKSLQGLQESLSVHEKDLREIKKKLTSSNHEDLEYVEKISDLVMDCNNLSRDITFILFVFEELSYVSKKLAATTLTLKYDLMILKYDLIIEYLIFVKNKQADNIVHKSMKILKRIFKTIEETTPLIDSRIKFMEDSYYLTN